MNFKSISEDENLPSKNSEDSIQARKLFRENFISPTNDADASIEEKYNTDYNVETSSDDYRDVQVNNGRSDTKFDNNTEGDFTPVVPKKKIIGGGTLALSPTRICVMGIGGGGVNATNMMTDQRIKDVDIVAVNTDVQSLNYSRADIAMPLGHSNFAGLGAGGDPLKAAEAARNSHKSIYEWVKNYDMIFIAAGLGGGTGTGAAPVIAEIAKEAGVLTLAVVTLPFAYEGKRRFEIAQKGLEELELYIDALLVIPNENIMKNDFHSHDVGVAEGFEIVDKVLTNTVKSISEIITVTSVMNIDFADIKSCLSKAGRIAVGFGVASDSEDGKHGNAQRAVESAFKNSVLSHDNMEIMKQANYIIANTVAGPDVSINDYAMISDLIASRVQTSGEHSFKHGYRINKDWGKKIQVTIIASERDQVSRMQNQHVSKRGRGVSHGVGLGHGLNLGTDFGDHDSSLHRSQDEYPNAEYEFTKKEHHNKEVLKINSDYVRSDTFEKLINQSELHQAEYDVFDQELNKERLQTPAVNRLLGFANNPVAADQSQNARDRDLDTKTR